MLLFFVSKHPRGRVVSQLIKPDCLRTSCEVLIGVRNACLDMKLCKNTGFDQFLGIACLTMRKSLSVFKLFLLRRGRQST
jgi:hypothetical protein